MSTCCCCCCCCCCCRCRCCCCHINSWSSPSPWSQRGSKTMERKKKSIRKNTQKSEGNRIQKQQQQQHTYDCDDVYAHLKKKLRREIEPFLKAHLCKLGSILHMYEMYFLARWQAFLFRLRVVSRALGCGARRGPACVLP